MNIAIEKNITQKSSQSIYKTATEGHSSFILYLWVCPVKNMPCKYLIDLINV